MFAKHGHPQIRREMNEPYIRREMNEPYIRREMNAPYFRRETNKPYIRREMNEPYFRREVNGPHIRGIIAYNGQRKKILELKRRIGTPPFHTVGIQGISEACNPQFPIGKRAFWGILWLIMLVVCVIQCVVCTRVFLSSPTTTSISYHNVKTITPPCITLCVDDEEDRRPAVWQPYLQEMFGNISYSNSYDLLLKTNMTIRQLWNISKFVVNESSSTMWQISHEDSDKEPLEKTELATVNGVCLTYKPTMDMPCTGKKTLLHFEGLGTFPKPEHDYMIIFHSEAEYPLLRYHGPHVDGLFLSYNQLVAAALQITEYRYVTSWKNPCLSAEKFYECEADCFDSMIRKESNLSTLCRLPFMKENNLPLCSSTSQFKAMYKATDVATEKMFDETNHCNCPNPCKKIVFTEDYITEYPLDDPLDEEKMFVFDLFFPKCKLTVIEESYSYTTANFISEVGGTLGIFLGMSVLNIIAIFENVCLKCRR